MTDSTTGDLERKIVLAVREATGSGWPPDKPPTENELNYVRAALKAHAEWLEERNKVSNDWPCLLAKHLVQKAAGYHHDHPFWDFSGLQSEDLRQIQAMLAAAKQEDQHHD